MMAQHLHYISNEEIRNQMRNYGYSVGPVTDSNRSIYVKKLQELMSTEPTSKNRLSRLSSEEDTDDAESPFSNTRKKKRTLHYLTSSYSKNLPASSEKSEPCILPGFRVPSVRAPRRNVHDKWARDSKGRQQFIGLYDNHSSEESDGQNRKQPRALPDRRSSYQRIPQDGLLDKNNLFTLNLRSAYGALGNLLTALKRRFLKANSSIENNGFIQLPRSFYAEPDGSSLSENFLTTEERNWFSRHYQSVPKTLLWIVMLFFFGLTVSYIVLIEVKSFHSQKGNIPICQTKNLSEKCVDKHALPAAMKLIKAIHPLVEERSRKYACESLFGNVSSEAQPLMRSDLLIHLQEKRQNYTPSAIVNMETLILANPHWGIALKEVDNDVVYLSSPLSTPVTCYTKYILHWLVQRIIKTALWTVFAVGVFKLASAYNAYVQTYKQKVHGMVARIRKYLRTEYHRNGEQPFIIPIDDVYDQLIPIRDRKRLGVLWSSAVNYIRQNDKNIKEENIYTNGELRRVWRWVAKSGTLAADVSSVPENSMQENPQENVSTTSDDVGSSEFSEESSVQQTESGGVNYRSSRIWQGQAFETMAGSPNSVPCSPTPCLKIRHMFDPDTEQGESWPTFIRDAILEKCEGVSILHLYVDKTSREGCVYVKCRTSEDAGRAYCALHGWWFGNSHLVTVKYLRIERYHERFPEAVTARVPLQPLGNRRTSVGK